MGDIGLGQALMGLLVAAVLGGGSAVFIWNSFQNLSRTPGGEFESRILEELRVLRERVDALTELVGTPATRSPAEDSEKEAGA